MLILAVPLCAVGIWTAVFYGWATSKTRPDCAGRIRWQARVCRYWGHDLAAAEIDGMSP